MRFSCVKGEKIGDSLIRKEDGSLLSIYPDSFYERNTIGYFLLRKVGDIRVLIRVLRI